MSKKSAGEAEMNIPDDGTIEGCQDCPEANGAQAQAIEEPADEGASAGAAAEGDATGASAKSERELLEAKDKLLRLAAEYDNFRKRTAREREVMYGTVVADTISMFLPVLDNLQRAETAPTSDPAYAQGIAMITKQFTDILAKAGVEEIEAIGKPFDSELHNAVMHEEREGAGESEVVEVFQKGYKTASRVIRHSVVKVAN